MSIYPTANPLNSFTTQISELAEAYGYKSDGDLAKSLPPKQSREGSTFLLVYRVYHFVSSRLSLSYPSYTPTEVTENHRTGMRYPTPFIPEHKLVKVGQGVGEQQRCALVPQSVISCALRSAFGKVSSLDAVLDGSEAEVYTESATTVEQLPLSHWETWPSDSWEKRRYREHLYPAVIHTAIALLHKMDEPVGVAEIGAGDGELAEKLLTNRSLKDRIRYYNGIEIGKANYEAADKRLSGPIAAQRMRLRRGDFLCETVCFDKRDERPRLALAVGALTEQVLESKEEAASALKAIYSSLHKEKESYCIVTGYAPPLLHYPDYRGQGFQVLQLSAKDSTGRLFPFALLRKS